MTTSAPSPVKPGNTKPPHNGNGDHGHGDGRGHGNGHGQGQSHGQPGKPFTFPKRRNSIWPFLLDLGLAMGLFGLIITGRPLIVIGGALAVVAFIGWLREARAEYARLDD